jgi:hypothetical protein
MFLDISHRLVHFLKTPQSFGDRIQSKNTKLVAGDWNNQQLTKHVNGEAAVFSFLFY